MMTNVTNDKKAEQKRGFKEGSQQFELLRARWPKAFSVKAQGVRPLASGAQQALAEALGWTPYYAHGVLAAWKTRQAYCQAILHYPMRINLDGSVSDEDVSDSGALWRRRVSTRRLRGGRKRRNSGDCAWSLVKALNAKHQNPRRRGSPVQVPHPPRRPIRPKHASSSSGRPRWKRRSSVGSRAERKRRKFWKPSLRRR
jgi:sRNA-binding protein